VLKECVIHSKPRSVFLDHSGLLAPGLADILISFTSSHSRCVPKKKKLLIKREKKRPNPTPYPPKAHPRRELGRMDAGGGGDGRRKHQALAGGGLVLEVGGVLCILFFINVARISFAWIFMSCFETIICSAQV